MAEAETAIGDLIGTSTASLSSATAFYAVLAPQDAVRPFVTFEVITEEVRNVMSVETNPTTALFSISIFAATLLEVVNITNDMRTVFNRYNGTTTGGSVVVQNVFYEGRNDFFNESDRDYQRVLDFRMFFEE